MPSPSGYALGLYGIGNVTKISIFTYFNLKIAMFTIFSFQNNCKNHNFNFFMIVSDPWQWATQTINNKK